MPTAKQRSLGRINWRRTRDYDVEAAIVPHSRIPGRWEPFEEYGTEEPNVEVEPEPEPETSLPPPPCFIHKVANDVLVVEIFGYLDLMDILRLRQVCKRYYDLTHAAALWKGLLRRAKIPLPPVPPTSRYSIPNLSGLEAERLLLRATSLHRAWAKPDLNYMQAWDFNAHHIIHSMILLPGGPYLVASVADKANANHAIVVYVMDHFHGGAVALAKIPTGTKAYHLQGRYLTVGGQRSIVIAYVRRDYRRSKDAINCRAPHGVDISQYSAEHKIEPEVPIKYECAVLTISLEQLEILADNRVVPGTPQFMRHAQNLPAPFRLLACIRTRRQLIRPSLDEIFGSPYLAVVRQPNSIMFKKLDGGAVSTLTCASHPGHELASHEILCIRLISCQNSILVFRKVHQPRRPDGLPHEEYINLYEQYHVVPNGQRPVEVERMPFDEARFLVRNDVVEVQITDHGLRARGDDSLMPALYSAADTQVPLPIMIYARTAKRTLDLFTLFPRPIQYPIELASTSSTSPIIMSQTIHVAYEYVLSERTMATRLTSPDQWEWRVLPGTARSIIYLTPTVNISDTPPVEAVYRYSHPLNLDETRANMELEDGLADSVCVPVTLPSGIDTTCVSAMAWDESIGRLCIATLKSPRVWVVDFGRAPRTDVDGNRLPVPVMLSPNPDLPNMPNPILDADNEQNVAMQVV